MLRVRGCEYSAVEGHQYSPSITFQGSGNILGRGMEKNERDHSWAHHP